MAIRASNVTAQVLYMPTGISKSVTDTILFEQECERRKIRVCNFTVQVLQLEAGKFGTASDDIDFEDLVSFTLIIEDRKIASSTLAFVDSVTSPSFPQVFDVLSFIDEARSSIFNLDVSHILGLHDIVPGYCWGAPWTAIEIEDTLDLLDWTSDIEPQSVTDTITFSDEAHGHNAQEGQFIDFTQIVSAGKGLSVSSELEFTSTIDTSGDFLRSITHDNVVEHSMTYYIDNSCNQKYYARFVGEGSADSIDEQRLNWDANMAIESMDGDLVLLRNPEMDDHDRLGFSRINRETQGGELNVYSDPIWGKVNTLLFTIVALSDGKNGRPDILNDTLDFFQDHIGEEIYLHDWTGTSWRGVITTPNERAVEDDEGFWTVTFEFEGVEEPGCVPLSGMVLSHTLSMIAEWARGATDTLTLTDEAIAGGDIYAEASDILDLEDEVEGTHEILVLYDELAGGAAAELHGKAPTTGTGTWSANQYYQDDGTMSAPVNAGAYFPISLLSGTVYELTFLGAHVVTYEDGFACIWGFFEDVVPNKLLEGSSSNGNLNPTCAKAVHLMREVSVGTRNNAYRRGSESDGAADTHQWTDAALRASADDVLDLRIVLDTASWKTTWYAKAVLSANYTEVGPETSLLSNNIGAIGFSCDTSLVELTTNYVTLKELRAI